MKGIPENYTEEKVKVNLRQNKSEQQKERA